MGLFSRKKSGQKTSSGSRSVTSSEAQAAELRARARRRLIGALVLVLAAVIVVPMMFDQDIDAQMDTPVVLPAIVPPAPDPDRIALVQPDYAIDEPTVLEDPFLAPDAVDTDSEANGDTTTLAPETPQTTVEDGPIEDVAAVVPTPAEMPPAEASKPKPKPPVREKPRTDDGSRALALLEGRIPTADTNRSTAAPQTQGSFILQVAAYSAENDAEARRTRLVDAGVTNAYVEQGISNGKTTYRLRVGSFPTRDAATAAQARLRALGYDNSLLLTR